MPLLNCNITTGIIILRCSILSSINYTIEDIEWLTSNSAGVEEILVPTRIDRSINPGSHFNLYSHQIFIDISTQSNGVQFRCRPRLNNGSSLTPSQSITIQTNVSFRSDCQGNLFSMWSCRCADNVSNTTPTEPSSTTTSASCNVTSIDHNPSSTTMTNTAVLMTDEIHFEATSYDISSMSMNPNSVITHELASTNFDATFMSNLVSPECNDDEQGSRTWLGVTIFIPMLGVSVIVIIVQLLVQVMLLYKLKVSKNSRQNDEMQSSIRPIITSNETLSESTNHNSNELNNFTDVNYMSVLSGSTPAIYIHPPNNDQHVTTNQAEMPHQYAPLFTESMNASNDYQHINREESNEYQHLNREESNVYHRLNREVSL